MDAADVIRNEALRRPRKEYRLTGGGDRTKRQPTEARMRLGYPYVVWVDEDEEAGGGEGGATRGQ